MMLKQLIRSERGESGQLPELLQPRICDVEAAYQVERGESGQVPELLEPRIRDLHAGRARLRGGEGRSCA